MQWVVEEDPHKVFDRFVMLLRARNVKDSSIDTYVKVLRRFLRWSWRRGRGVHNWNADLATQYIAGFNNPNTRFSYAQAIKLFFKLLEYPDADKFKVPRRPKSKLPDILSEAEILRLARACDNARDRALILVTYESSRRNHEVRGLRIRDVEFDEHGALVTFHSNKSEDATIRLILSASVLQTVIEHHRDRDNPNAYVFYAKNNQITEQRFRQIVREAARKAGLKRRVYPHLLRHSRIAKLKREKKLSDDDIMNITGHSDRRQLDRYGRITMTMTNDKLLEIEGLRREVEKPKPKAHKCPRCGYINGPLAKYCGHCSLVLDEREAVKLMEDKKILRKILEILRDPEKLETFIDLIRHES